jgi:hypothetical protein
MAGFEVVVRPVVFPDIRPAPARSLPPQDDPAKGMCVITGGGSFPVQLSFSTQVSTSKSKEVETERRVDETRVYQMDDNGAINRDNFVDLEIANRIKMRSPGREENPANAADGERSKGNSLEIARYYARQLDAANIEITRRNQIRKNEEAGE